MSDSTQLVRDWWAAINRGDVEASLACIHPSIVWWPAADELIVEPYRGHEGCAELFASTREGVPDIQAEIEELFTAGDRVVTRLRFWGRGGQSGVPVEIHETQVMSFSDGKIIELREYREMDQALEALRQV